MSLLTPNQILPNAGGTLLLIINKKNSQTATQKIYLFP